MFLRDVDLVEGDRLAPEIGLQVTQVAFELRRRAGALPRWASALSPRPMPSTARPLEIRLTDVIDVAVAAAWRVIELVTPVPRPSFCVTVAAMASAT